jgi:hypothetical protein
MCRHPCSSRFHVSVRQEIDHLVTLQVDKDGPKSTAPSNRKVVNPKLRNLSNRSYWKRHHPAENGHPGRLYPKPISYASRWLLLFTAEKPHISRISRSMVGFTLVGMSLAACAESETEIR